MYASVVNVAAQGKMLKQVCWIAYSFSFKIIFLLMSTNWPLKELAFFFFWGLYCAVLLFRFAAFFDSFKHIRFN